MIEYLITRNAGEEITVRFDGTKYALIRTSRLDKKTIILNPDEANRLAVFIKGQVNA